MVRWARHNGQGGKKKELEASSWQELKGGASTGNGSGGGGGGGGAGSSGSGSKTGGVANGGVQKRFLPAFMRDTRYVHTS